MFIVASCIGGHGIIRLDSETTLDVDRSVIEGPTRLILDG